MARQLQAYVVALGLEARAFRLREGQAVGDCPRTEGVTWEDLAPTWRRGDRDAWGSSWAGVVEGDRWTARATLSSSSGAFTTDADWDTATNGPRTARTPALRAAGLRAWLGLEVVTLEPTAATTVLFRLVDLDAGDELAWTGAEWAAQVSGDDDPTTWNTAADLQGAFPQLPGNVRALAVLAWLRTTTTTAAPSFLGVRVAYGVRQVSPLDDALFRTLLARLRAELEAVAVLEWTTATETEAVELADPDGQGPDPFNYQVIGVDGVWDLTDDPDELTELPGTWDGALWTPDAPIAAAHLVRLEARYRPDVVIRRHQDAEHLARLPAVYVSPGDVSRTLAPQGTMLVRDVNASPPVALELPEPATLSVPLELRIVAELGADVERLGQALTAFLATTPDGGTLGHGTGRVLLSPETGMPIEVRAVRAATESPAALAQGVAEARAAWLLTFARATAHTVTTAAPLVSETGAAFTLES